ncbi:MAG: AAA family ATPase [Burkholderiaceae bacterium]|nr:AAA family ATPase [Burkholderiaceae bacterium]
MHENSQQILIRALRNPSVFPHAADRWQLIETHISWVVLCGPYAYKIKKALDLGFLDFTTLVKRRFYCEEELRLNSRLAPDLYLAVVPVTGTAAQPQLGGPGAAVEYAVKMRRFSQCGLLSDMARHDRLKDTHIDQIVTQVAKFHLEIPCASAEAPYGTPDHVHAPVLENYVQILEHTDDPRHVQWINDLKVWTDRQHRRCYRQFERRKQQGFVRECHGDMHLGNIAMVDDAPVIFDGIEFNPDLYWIDVMSEVAFLFMDLEGHDKRDYAFRFLNGYLELSGDYSGLQVLPYYLAYRATVRAKIASIRLIQDSGRDTSQSLEELERHLKLAISYTQPQRRVLLITHGLSGSGKSTLLAPISEHMGAIRIRSDRERQRLFGKGERDGVAAGIGSGVYSSDATLQTYATLENLAQGILESGYPVIVDATFLTRSQREPFKLLARRLEVPLRILFFHADAAELKRRVEARRRNGRDISEADLTVLEHQLQVYSGLEADEQNDTIAIDTQSTCDSRKILALITNSLMQPPEYPAGRVRG